VRKQTRNELDIVFVKSLTISLMDSLLKSLMNCWTKCPRVRRKHSHYVNLAPLNPNLVEPLTTNVFEIIPSVDQRFNWSLRGVGSVLVNM
jgi:hypothetical protein